MPLLAGALRLGLGEDAVRMVAPTICWAALGTKERALHMKCTRHLCQQDPTKTIAPALFKPR